MDLLLPLSWQPIQQELEGMIIKLRARMHCAERSLLNSLLPSLEQDLLVPPALVFFSARLFPEKDKIDLPASFMEIIHLGTVLHALAGRRDGKEQQMSILVGDYLFSQLFHLICETDCLFLLERFSTLITEMNEGFACQEESRQKSLEPSRDELLIWLQKQYGTLFGECCALGTLFAGGKAKEQALLEEFGVSLGIAYGAVKSDYELSLSDNYLKKASVALFSLPESTARDELACFARELVQNTTDLLGA